jgi:hypothetical protein
MKQIWRCTCKGKCGSVVYEENGKLFFRSATEARQLIQTWGVFVNNRASITQEGSAAITKWMAKNG